MPRRLSIGGDPRPGESLPGFLVRMAHGIRCPNVDRFAGLVGLRQPGSAVTGIDLSLLANLVGADVGLLEAAAYRPAARHAHNAFLGGTLNREFILLERRRPCPRCLTEAACHRARWDLALATACPEHRVRLHDFCYRCQRPLGWHSSDMLLCRCGTDLRNAAQPVSQEEASANQAILDLVSEGAVDWLPAIFERCERADLVKFVMCLGLFITDWRGQRRIEAVTAAGQDIAAGVLITGIKALRNWPQSVHGYLETQSEGSKSRPGKYGARKTLGTFYDWVTMMEAGAIKAALASALTLYVNKDPALARRSHRSRLIAAPSEPKVVGLNQAAAMLRLSGETVKRLMADGLLPETVSEGRGVPMLINGEAVTKLAVLADDALDLKTAAVVLGISRARFRLLLDRGVIEALIESDQAKVTRTFSSACLRLLLQVFEEFAKGAADEKSIGFEAAVEALRRRGVDFAKVIDRLKRGDLRACAVDDTAIGLKRLRFSAVRVREMCRMLEMGPTMTVQAAAERLGLKWQVVSHLAARGFITQRDGLLTTSEVEAFQAAYVTGSELAMVRGTSPRNLAAELARHGIQPVVGPGVDGSRQNIYRRSEIRGIV